MANRDAAARLLAADKRIDDLIDQASQLVSDLNATVANMKEILTAAGDDVAEQQRLRREEPG